MNDDSKEQFYDADDSIDSTINDPTNDEFIPLHERLNKNMKLNKDATKIQSDSGEEEEEVYNNLEDDDTQSNDDKEQDKNVDNEYFIDESEERTNEEDKLDNSEREKRLNEANEFKRIGNDYFKEEKLLEAIKEYTEALRRCPLCYKKEMSIFYSNRSACFMKLDNMIPQTIADCSKSIQYDPNFMKPIQRRAECLQTTDKLDESLEDYKRLVQLDDSKSSSYYYRKIQVQLLTIFNLKFNLIEFKKKTI
jgi:tetratricopeptide (TPR) repeat protein